MSGIMSARRRIVVGISGASGAIYGVRLLKMLAELDIESHLVMSRSAQVTLAHEMQCGPPTCRRLPTFAIRMPISVRQFQAVRFGSTA